MYFGTFALRIISFSTVHSRVELMKWLSPTNLRLGVPFSTPDPALTRVTDASSYRTGGAVTWVTQQHLPSGLTNGMGYIIWLELQVVWLTLKHFLGQVQNQVIEVLLDDSTTVSYINKLSGTHSLIPRPCACLSCRCGTGDISTTEPQWQFTCRGHSLSRGGFA